MDYEAPHFAAFPDASTLLKIGDHPIGIGQTVPLGRVVGYGSLCLVLWAFRQEHGMAVLRQIGFEQANFRVARDSLVEVA